MSAPTKRLGQTEFVAMMALMTATTAFSIDAMLPALPDIAAELSPTAPNRAQLILTSFLIGMGFGTLFTGVLSDRFGRRPVIAAGAILYIASSLAAYYANSLEWMLAARLLQGIGAAGPRVVAVAIVRDLYSGRDMARILSFIMLLFTLVPGVAPAVGAVIIAYFSWHAIFVSFIVFGAVSSGWLMLRQPETLAPENRRPLRLLTLVNAAREVYANPSARYATIGQTLASAMIFIVLFSTHGVFDQAYGQGANFPYWVAGISVIAAFASILNARLVVRLGMRRIIKATFGIQMALSALFGLVMVLGLPAGIELYFYAAWTATIFFQAGLTFGNLSALALEPLGHIAGSASSVITAAATIGAVAIATPIGQMFNGTAGPLVIGVFCCAGVALWVSSQITRESD